MCPERCVTYVSERSDFTFTENGQPRQGVCIMTTILTAPGTAGQGWKAIPGICTAPADKMSIALSVLGHLAVQKWSAQWAAQTNQSAGVYSEKIEADFQKSMTGSTEAIDNILTGSQDLKGPDGQPIHVAAGHNYYYYSGGRVVGTNSPTPPDIGFTPLTKM